MVGDARLELVSLDPKGGYEALVDQPPPQPSEGDMWQSVMDDMAERRIVGIGRYGTPLQPFNGREPLVDAYQEELDKIVYLRQAIEEVRQIMREREELKATIADLRATLTRLSDFVVESGSPEIIDAFVFIENNRARGIGG